MHQLGCGVNMTAGNGRVQQQGHDYCTQCLCSNQCECTQSDEIMLSYFNDIQFVQNATQNPRFNSSFFIVDRYI